MICNKCLKQMSQLSLKGVPQGWGEVTEKKYKTVEIKVCLDCNRRVKETYIAQEICSGGSNA